MLVQACMLSWILNAWNGGAGIMVPSTWLNRGYLVMTIDTYRVALTRAREFEQQIFRIAGKVQMEDLMSVVDFQIIAIHDKGTHGFLFDGASATL